MNTPSAEEFLEASTLYNLYKDDYTAHVLPLIVTFIENFYESDIEEFIDEHEQVRLNILDKILATNCKLATVVDWFDKQPAVISVFGKVKEKFLSNRKNIFINELCYQLMFYYMTETEILPEKLEKIKTILSTIPKDKMTEADIKVSSYLKYHQEQHVQQLINDRKPRFTLHTLNDLQYKFRQKSINLKEKMSSPNSSYIFFDFFTLQKLGVHQTASFYFVKFISELARMANWYVTNAYLERVTVSKDRIDKIIKLLSSLRDEVDLMLNTKWCPSNLGSLCLPHRDIKGREIGRGSIEVLRAIQKKELSIAKRKDQTVQERLMVVDLIRTHKKIYFRDISKRDIYKLMELPFINNFIEMKTIERIIKSEEENQTTLI